MASFFVTPGAHDVVVVVTAKEITEDKEISVDAKRPEGTMHARTKCSLPLLTGYTRDLKYKLVYSILVKAVVTINRSNEPPNAYEYQFE
jgi:hypothetical protein